MEFIYLVMGLFNDKEYNISAYSTKGEARARARQFDEDDKRLGFKVGKECHHFVEKVCYFK